MSDKELISRGAQVVAGDLILHRKTVGRYRHGQFILTPEGADELQNVVEVSAVEVPAAEPAAKLPAKAPKAKKAAVSGVAPKAPAPAPAEDAVDVAALDNLLDNLTP